MKFRQTLVSVSAFSCALLMVGCSQSASSLVGDWKDPEYHTELAELTLKSDGTGYWKPPFGAEMPIKWGVDGKRVLVGVTEESKKDLINSDQTMIGRIADDQQRIDFDRGDIEFHLIRQN